LALLLFDLFLLHLEAAFWGNFAPFSLHFLFDVQEEFVEFVEQVCGAKLLNKIAQQIHSNFFSRNNKTNQAASFQIEQSSGTTRHKS